MLLSVKKAAHAALLSIVSVSLVACGPQSLQPHFNLNSDSAQTLTQPAGLKPPQPVPYQAKGFGVQSQSQSPRVLMILPNLDFWYADYSLPRQALESQGIQVTVAAPTTALAYPHLQSGQGADGGIVQPDLSVQDAQASDYDAILFVGGWGMSVYQSGFNGQYLHAPYNGSPALRTRINQLVNDFISQDKYVSALCFGVTALAWARVNGVSPLNGLQVSGWHGPAPATTQGNLPTSSRAHLEVNGAQMLASGSIGNPATVSDDVMVNGKIITAEDYRAGEALGLELAQRLLAESQPVATPTASAVPTPIPTPVPTAVPTPIPTPVPTAVPTASPVPVPSSIPSPLPVLLVIANQDFYYREYAEPRRELLAAGIPVVVAATERRASFPHPGTGQGNTSGEVMPDLRLDQVDADDYSAIVFVGGWGSSQYQYAFTGQYAHAPYNGNAATKLVVNNLINDFADQNKYVMGICHGASVLAWARIDGVSPLAGRRATGGPWLPNVIGSGPVTTRDYIEGNQGIYVPSRSVGDPTTAADDLIVDGRFITAEDYDTAELAGETLARLLQER